MKDEYPICQNDGFPMLEINGRLECVAEYLEECLAFKTITDLNEKDKTISILFNDGHELPLLCPCCGEVLSIEDIEAERIQLSDSQLESITIEILDHGDGREFIHLILWFLKKTNSHNPTFGLALSLNVAKTLQHPDSCPQVKHQGISQ